MWSVVLSALAARRGRTVILLFVALLATAAVAAAPWYAVAASHDVVANAVARAPAEDRLISVSRRVSTGDVPPDDPASEVRRVFDPDGFRTATGAEVTAQLSQGAGAAAGSVEVALVERDAACGYLTLAGACPAAADEVIVPTDLSETAGVEIGDEVELVQGTDDPAAFRVVGTYDIADPEDPYWGGFDPADGRVSTRPAVFTTLAAMRGFERVTYTYHLMVEPATVATMDLAEFEAMVDAGVEALRAQNYAVNQRGLAGLLERLPVDQRNVVLGIGVGAVVLLLLTWFTLVVVLRGTVIELRGDIGWWRLHGAPSVRGALAALGQSAAPLLVGAAGGSLAGIALGRAAGGGVPTEAANQLAWRLTLGLVGVAVAGGLVAVVATQLGALRTPVRDLLRRVPARGRRWQRSVVDLLVILVAAAAVGQALVAGREAEGVALLAPPLTVLAIALVAAWAVLPLVAVLAARALHRGRLAVALTAASIARRTGTHRLFALVAVAVALVTAGFVGWDRDARTQWQRAALETGADRVLTVEVDGPNELLAAVREVDPAGQYAMAVVHRPARSGHPAVLAVDTTRLHLVAGWRDEYGGRSGAVAAALRPPAPEPVEVTGERLAVEATVTSAPGAPVRLRAWLVALDTGERVEAVLGPLTGDRETHDAPTPQCAGSGCRLVGFELLGAENPDDDGGGYGLPEPGTRVELFPLDGVPLDDPARWRPAVGPAEVGLAITPAGRAAAGGSGLSLAMPDPMPRTVETPWEAGVTLTYQPWAYVVDAPVPLPMLSAGWQWDPSEEARLAPLPGTEVPAQVVGTASLLPVHPRSSVLVDLEYATRLVPFPPTPGTTQVWLSGAAPSSIVDDLAAAGVTTVRDETLAGEVARLRAEGSAVGVRFQTAVGLVALLLATGAVLMSAAHERPGRAAELAALRAQGVGARTVRAVGYGSLLAVVVPAALVGLIAGLASNVVALALHPGFVDGWELLPLPPLRPYPVAGALATAAGVLGAAMLSAAVALIRGTRARTAGGPA